MGDAERVCHWVWMACAAAALTAGGLHARTVGWCFVGAMWAASACKWCVTFVAWRSRRG